jgi:hypothetical protein
MPVMGSASSVGLLCINPAQGTGNRAFMTEQAEGGGLASSFVAAIHGSEPERPFDRYGYDEVLARIAKEITPPNEAACFSGNAGRCSAFSPPNSPTT